MEAMTLREQVAREIYESMFIGDWFAVGEIEQALHLQSADAVLKLLDGPNWRVIQRDRWDRVRRTADCGCDVSDDCCGKLSCDDLRESGDALPA